MCELKIPKFFQKSFSRVLKNKTLEQDIGTTKSNFVDHAINQNVNNYTDGSQTALFVVVPLFIILTIACAILVFVLKRQRDHGKPLKHLHLQQHITIVTIDLFQDYK